MAGPSGKPGAPKKPRYTFVKEVLPMKERVQAGPTMKKVAKPTPPVKVGAPVPKKVAKLKGPTGPR